MKLKLRSSWDRMKGNYWHSRLYFTWSNYWMFSRPLFYLGTLQPYIKTLRLMLCPWQSITRATLEVRSSWNTMFLAWYISGCNSLIGSFHRRFKSQPANEVLYPLYNGILVPVITMDDSIWVENGYNLNHKLLP